MSHSSTPRPPLLHVRGVHKSYAHSGREVHALRGVDLAIDEPGFYAIMGASGSGKSTLLHLLGALDRPDQGEICVAGVDVGTMDDREATRYRRERVGIVFQQFNLIPTLSARENIELPGLLAGRSQADLRERSTRLLSRLGLDDRADHRPDALSGGEQQRVAIARGLLFSPPILLADEPTGNLDSVTSDRLWRLLGDVALEHAMLVLMVTHEPAAAAHCRRIFFLRDGRVGGTIDAEGLDAGALAARYQDLARAT
ncbi:MAG: ABC transporter ATP-binding protein [Phycisphaerales bacterium]|nr:ABC transporter ATP-binding protein [Phycisphaerales bacterium]